MNPDNRRNGAPVPRVYVELALAVGARFVMPEAPGHHLSRVLRLRAGDALTLFDGRGGEYAAVISAVGKPDVAVEVGAWRDVEREPALDVHLAQGVSAGERMDFTLQKAVELGIAGVQPLATERSVVRLEAERAEKRRGHWERVVVRACEQCGRNRVPVVSSLEDLHAWLAMIKSKIGSGVGVILSPDAEHSLTDLPRPEQPFWLLAGPEGGFAPAERAAALRAGFTPVRLGPRILRTETAALAAIAALQALWGDF